MALYYDEEERKRAAQQAKKPAETGQKEIKKVIDTSKIPHWTDKLELNQPTMSHELNVGHPILPVPKLSLDVPTGILSGDGLRGIHLVLPAAPPPWLPSPSPKPSSPGASQGDINKIWELDFDMDVEPQSLMGQTLMRLHLPLKSEAQESMERTKQILAVIAGKDAQDTTVGLQLINTTVNLLGATPQAQRFLKKLCIDNVSVVFDPSKEDRKYGLKVEFELK